jgi:hypothetical protein
VEWKRPCGTCTEKEESNPRNLKKFEQEARKRHSHSPTENNPHAIVRTNDRLTTADGTAIRCAPADVQNAQRTNTCSAVGTQPSQSHDTLGAQH